MFASHGDFIVTMLKSDKLSNFKMVNLRERISSLHFIIIVLYCSMLYCFVLYYSSFTVSSTVGSDTLLMIGNKLYWLQFS